MSATLRVVHVGPLVTLQDAGRFGRLRFGVPASGPMDALAHASANAALGNDIGATAIEISLGGLQVECGAESVTIAVTGGATVEHLGADLGSCAVVTLQPAERLIVRAGARGSWAYLAVAGELAVDEWLDSASTHAISGLGGGSLQAGQLIDVRSPRVETEREGSFDDVGARDASTPIRVVFGPQQHHFLAEARDRLCSQTFALTEAYDRMGVRLDGPLLPLGDALSIPSEPIVRGSIQVTGDGVATVLLADHQTTGGYPKIATVISCDLDRLVQHRAGDTVRFAAVDPAMAIDLARRHARDRINMLERIGRPGRNVAARLMKYDLIGDSAASAFEAGDARPEPRPPTEE